MRYGEPACDQSFALTRRRLRASEDGGGSYPDRMELEFTGEIWFWKGPSPFHFVTVPEEQSAAIESVAALVSYGWGVIPVAARIGGTDWTTSLFPKEGGYVLPLKDAVRRSEGLMLGDTAAVRLEVGD